MHGLWVDTDKQPDHHGSAVGGAVLGLHERWRNAAHLVLGTWERAHRGAAGGFLGM